MIPAPRATRLRFPARHRPPARLGRLAVLLAVLLPAPLRAQDAGTLAGPPPPPPENVTATPESSTRIDVEWSEPDDDDGDEAIVGYRVYRDGVLVGSTSGTAFSDEGLQASTTYGYQVSAVDDKAREGERSATVQATTFADDSPPGAPADLAAQAVGPTEVRLTWTAAQDPESGIAAYRVYRDGVFRAETSATTFDDQNLLPLTTYRYVVRAVNGEGLEGPPSDEAEATTPLLPDQTPPTAPGDLQATAVSPTQIDLAWSAAEDPQSGVFEYRIYRDGSLAGSATGTSFADVGRLPQTTYRYVVTAVNGEGLEGPPSEEAEATTPAEPDATPPTAPGGLTATAVSPTRIDLAWTAASDSESGVAEYRVYRDGLFLASTPGTALSDEDGLVPETTYRYVVTAVNGEGLEGPPSQEAEATTPAEPDPTPPTAPTGLTATAVSTTRIDLAWTAASDPESGISGYRVYRDGGFVAATASPAYADEGLQPGTTYRYRVTAVNGEGVEGPPSGEARATTPEADDATPPTAPAGLTAQPGSPVRVDLSWTAASDPESGVSEYRVYRDDVRVGSTVATAFSDTGLEPETEYRYRVTAVNGDGVEGPSSAEATATTPPRADTVPPAPPTGLRVVP